MQQLQGKNSKVYTDLKTQLIKMLAHVEAYIDFESDETNNFNDNHLGQLRSQCQKMIEQINSYLEKARLGETIREGFNVTIVGPPNAGKSTLMNLLADRNVSIVSSIPGTTRDLVSSAVTMGGY